MNFLHHWIYEDLWVPVWPNWFAGGVGALVAWFWGRAFEKRSIQRHEELKNIHTKMSDKINELHEHILSDPEEEA